MIMSPKKHMGTVTASGVVRGDRHGATPPAGPGRLRSARWWVRTASGARHVSSTKELATCARSFGHQGAITAVEGAYVRRR
jgi:hypothetical protein